MKTEEREDSRAKDLSPEEMEKVSGGLKEQRSIHFPHILNVSRETPVSKPGDDRK